MSDIRKTLGDLDELPSFDGTEVGEYYKASNGTSYKKKLGTAASADVTTSETDTTSGRVMRVGDGGLLGESIALGDVDLNTITDSGFYSCRSSANGTLANNYPVSTFVGTIIVIPDGGAPPISRGTQIATERGSQKTFTRTVDGAGVYSDWRELLDSGNYPSDTAWTTVTSLDNGWTGTVRYIKRAGWVTVVIDDCDGSSQTSTQLLQLPSGYRHTVNVRFASYANGGACYSGQINSVGGIQVFGPAASDIRATITYPVI